MSYFLNFPQKPFAFSTQIPVLVEHINLGNHVSHDSLVSLLHEARCRFLHSKNLQEIHHDQTGMIMLEIAVQYKKEAFYGQILEFEVAVQSIKGVRCDLMYRVLEKSKGRLISQAVTKMAFFDYKNRKIIKPPKIFECLQEECI